MKLRAAFTMIELLVVVAIIAILAAIAVPNFLEAQVRSKVSRTMQDMSTVRTAVQAYYADAEAYPPNNPALRDFLQWCARDENLGPWAVSEGDGILDAMDMGLFDETMFLAELESATDGAASAVDASDGESSVAAGERTIADFRRDAIGRSRSAGVGPEDAALPLATASGYDLAVLTTPVAYYGSRLREDTFADMRGTPLAYINLHDLLPSAPARAKKFFGDSRFYLMCYGPDSDQGVLLNTNQETGGIFGDSVNPVAGPFIAYDPTNGTVSSGDIFMWGGSLPAGSFAVEPPAAQVDDPN